MSRQPLAWGVIASVLIVGIIGWHVTFPELWILGWMVIGPLLLLVCGRISDELQRVRSVDRLARFREGRCSACGYDLRHSPDRCPECGRLRERPEDPLPMVGTYDGAGYRTAMREVDWLLALREPTPESVWRSDQELRIARVLAGACRRIGGAPNGHFRPHDPFGTMLADPEAMVWLDMSFSLERELGIKTTTDDCVRFTDMTFGQVVAELANRTAVPFGDRATADVPWP